MFRVFATCSAFRQGRSLTATAPAFTSMSIPGSVRSEPSSMCRLAFEARAPRFEGVVTLTGPAGPKDAEAAQPWRIAAKAKADYSAARPDRGELRR